MWRTNQGQSLKEKKSALIDDWEIIAYWEESERNKVLAKKNVSSSKNSWGVLWVWWVVKMVQLQGSFPMFNPHVRPFLTLWPFYSIIFVKNILILTNPDSINNFKLGCFITWFMNRIFTNRTMISITIFISQLIQITNIRFPIISCHFL